MQALIAAGPMSILTPSAMSTSAAPERDDSARLPCFATGTPAPAAMKAAIVAHATQLPVIGQRVRVATWLVISSNFYQIEH